MFIPQEFCQYYANSLLSFAHTIIPVISRKTRNIWDIGVKRNSECTVICQKNHELQSCSRTARFRLNGVALKFISELQLSSYVYSSHTGPGRFDLKFFQYSLRDIYVTKSSSSRIMKVVNMIYSSPVLV